MTAVARRSGCRRDILRGSRHKSAHGRYRAVRPKAGRAGAVCFPRMSTVFPQASLQASPDPLWQEAERLFKAQHYEAAAEQYLVLAGHPQLGPMACLRLSMLASVQGRQREAVAAALAAFAARLPEPDLLEGLAKWLKQVGELRAMYACAHDLSVLRGRNPVAMLGFGTMLSDTGFHADGLEMLQRARNAGVRGAILDYQAGRCLQALGDPQAAARALLPALANDSMQAPALLALSELPASAQLDEELLLARLQGAIDRRDGDDPQLPMLLYALFAMLDRAGKPDAAWPALERGMHLRRRRSSHDPEAARALFEHLSALRPAAAASDGADDGAPRPVFVLGLPGSGRELLSQRLGTHPGVADAGESGDFIQQLRWCCDLAGAPTMDLALAARAESIDFLELGKRYLEHTQWRAPGKAVFLDRASANVPCVPHIVRALPQARILHVVRGPMDTCLANMACWSAGDAPWSHDQVEMADHYRNYRALMAQARALYPGRILDVRHDELMADPEAVLREVLDFCGLPWHEGLQAPLSGDVTHQWRDYESQLAPLKQRLGALAY